MWRAQVVAPSGEMEWRSIEAATREAAISQLVADGVSPLDLRSGKPTLYEILQQPVRLSVGLPVSEQALLLRQLATLVGSGIAVDRSLDLLADQSAHRTARRVIRDILVRVRRGGSLATGFEASTVFPAYVAGIIRSAEKGGRLGAALASVAERVELTAATRRQLITSLSYPAAILVATIGALFLVLTAVVPQFQPLFAGEEDRLPMLTRMVLAMSDLAVNHSGTIFTALGLVIVSLIIGFRVEAIREAFAPLRRWVPFIRLRDQYLAAQFSSLLGTLLANGITLVEALPLVRGALGKGRWNGFLADVERQIRAGHRLSASLARGDLLPTTVIRLIEVGEQSGKISETSLQAGKILNDAVRARIERIVSLVNPVAIITLGGLVGMLVAGVMLGIFAMGDFTG